jgi:hypothetical protein
MSPAGIITATGEGMLLVHRLVDKRREAAAQKTEPQAVPPSRRRGVRSVGRAQAAGVAEGLDTRGR